MISYKTIYLICIILCLMGYSDSGATTEEQQLCKQNLQDEFDCHAGSVTSDKLALPKSAFKNKTLDQFQTIYGISYFVEILEKAATGLTNSPRWFCYKTRSHQNFPSDLCMEQLHEVYLIEDENNALPVIKWTYINKTEADIPKTYDAIKKDDEVVQLKHHAYAYFKHMLSHLDVYVSLPKAVAFCQSLKPHYRDKNQNYKKISYENPGESSRGEMTVKELNRANKRRRKNSEPNTLSSDD